MILKILFIDWIHPSPIPTGDCCMCEDHPPPPTTNAGRPRGVWHFSILANRIPISHQFHCLPNHHHKWNISTIQHLIRLMCTPFIMSENITAKQHHVKVPWVVRALSESTGLHLAPWGSTMIGLLHFCNQWITKYLQCENWRELA